MANQRLSMPLYEVKYRKNTLPKALELFVLCLLLLLVAYRLCSLAEHGLPWLLALCCESWFAFCWIISVNGKWSQIETETFPERLLPFWESELPAVDVFVTTADPVLEAPILTVNTVLSLLAVDYPANKLACYVSDDGASPITYYSLLEASKFAKQWIPFCKKYNVPVRAPFRYFNGQPTDNSPEFQQEWKRMKEEYTKLSDKIEVAVSKEHKPYDLTGEFEVFSNIDLKNHPTIIKVIWENKEVHEDGLPHIIYISREKHPKHPHKYKAGAMNVLTRVSGVMTNAALMMNVDCDMFANNPQIFNHAMCFFLGAKAEKDSAFVQFPQQFYDGSKDDPYGNLLVVLYEYMGRGIAGIQGLFYGGTNCFHRREVIYGLSPGEKFDYGKKSDEDLQRTFGKSQELRKSAAEILSGSREKTNVPGRLMDSIETAKEVASCSYEYGTLWGEQVGWMYGSCTEDVLTGVVIHGRGWRSVFYTLDPPAFLGCAPPAGPSALVQQKRWATGLLEVLVGPKSPIILTLFGNLQIRQCLAYLWNQIWAVRPIFEICYTVLPAYCLITNNHFLPKFDEPAMLIPLSALVTCILQGISEYIRAGESIKAWWDHHRIWRIITTSGWLFGYIDVILKLLGLSQISFEVTKKQEKTNEDDDTKEIAAKFTFDDSALFVPGTTILLVNLIALLHWIFRMNYESLGEVICSLGVVSYYWLFLKGLFAKGSYGIPTPTVLKSGALALLFLNLCKFSIQNA